MERELKKAKQAVAIYGLKEREASNITFNDVFASAEKGVYGNYASNIQFNNFQIESKKTEPFKFENSGNIQFRNVTILNPDIDRFGFAFTNCSDLLIKDCFQVESMNNYIRAENAESVYILNNVLPGVENLIEHKNSKVISQDNYLN